MAWTRICVLILLAGLASSSVVADEKDPAVKLSRSGICHERGTSSYGATLHYEPFDSLADCIKAGGRARKSKKGQPESHGSPAPVVDAPPAASDGISPEVGTSWGETLRGLATGPARYVLIGAAALLWAGNLVARRWSRRRFAALERDAGRRLRGHRFARFDRADYSELLSVCLGDRDLADRLIVYEMGRDPSLAREDAVTVALDRYRQDNS
jgi:hypothetical protein